MAEQGSEVLILEDDITLLESLKKAFQAHGFAVQTASTAAEAKAILNSKSIGYFFVDCLLPDASGVDLVAAIRSEFPSSKLKVVMMSGILTDASFVRETSRVTQAVAFLKKPFNLSEALDLVDLPKIKEADPKDAIPPRKLLYELLRQGKVDARAKKKAFEALEEIHGFDLPVVYNLLVETKASGYLNMATTDDRVFGITFAQGSIIQVDIHDEGTYFGKLLLDKGLVDPEDLKQVMETKEAIPKRLGHRLLERSLISPHAMDVVMGLQMNIRLSRTILDATLHINFVETDLQRTSPYIDHETFNSFLHDWIASKISLEWFRSHYVQWSDCKFEKGVNFSSDHSLLKMPIIQHMDDLLNFLLSGKTLSELLESKTFEEEPLYKAIHLLVLKGVLAFSMIANKNPEERTKVLQNIFEQFKGKNKIEVFELMTQMVGGDDHNPDFVIKNFKEILGPEPDAKYAERKKIYQTVRKLGEEAYQISTKANRTKLKEQFDKQDLEVKLKAAIIYEEARNQLQRSMYRAAYDNLKKAIAVDPQLQQIRLHLIWAKITLLAQSQHKEKRIREIEMDLLQIPPEEKSDALFHFVTGLLAKAKGDLSSAKKQFEKAVSMQPTMMTARRELTVVTKSQSDKKDVLNRDLRELVGSFFKKK